MATSTRLRAHLIRDHRKSLPAPPGGNHKFNPRGDYTKPEEWELLWARRTFNHRKPEDKLSGLRGSRTPSVSAGQADPLLSPMSERGDWSPRSPQDPVAARGGWSQGLPVFPAAWGPPISLGSVSPHIPIRASSPFKSPLDPQQQRQARARERASELSKKMQRDVDAARAATAEAQLSEAFQKEFEPLVDPSPRSPTTVRVRRVGVEEPEQSGSTPSPLQGRAASTQEAASAKPRSNSVEVLGLERTTGPNLKTTKKKVRDLNAVISTLSSQSQDRAAVWKRALNAGSGPSGLGLHRDLVGPWPRPKPIEDRSCSPLILSPALLQRQRTNH